MKQTKNIYSEFGKRILDILLATLFLFAIWPLLLLIGLIIKFSSPGPIIFKQLRVGKGARTFEIYKFRTMVVNADKLQKNFQKLNEADGPVFKIKNDPRFTPVGIKLSHTGLDELPQLVNILKGEMSFIGPRPLPQNEESLIEEKYQKIRRSVSPGIISSWLITGGHSLSFKQWMELDIKDIKNCCFYSDLTLLLKAFILSINLIALELKHAKNTKIISYPNPTSD